MNLFVLAVRNLLRSRLRTALTIFGAAASVVAFILLHTVLGAWQQAAQYAAKDRIATRHKLSFTIALPRRFAAAVREVPGVKHATFMSWFGGKDPLHPDKFFANYAVDAATFLDVYDEIALPDGVAARWRADRRGALVGRSLATQLGLKVGDTLTLEGSIFPGNWPLQVDGIYESTRKSLDASAVMFHWDYVNESVEPERRDEIGWITSRIDAPGDGPAVSKAIDRLFEDGEFQTTTMSERALNLSFLGMLSAVLGAVRVVALMILVIQLLILSGAIAIAVRERGSEYGALRALGFSRARIRVSIAAEAAAMGLAAGLLAVAVAWPMIDYGLGEAVEQNLGSLFPSFRVAPATLALALVLALVLGALAGVLPGRSATKPALVDALRAID